MNLLLNHEVDYMKSRTRLAGATVFAGGRAQFDYVNEDTLQVSCKHYLTIVNPDHNFSGPNIEDLWRCSIPDRISTSKKRETKSFIAPKIEIEGIWYVEASRERVYTDSQ